MCSPAKVEDSDTLETWSIQQLIRDLSTEFEKILKIGNKGAQNKDKGGGRDEVNRLCKSA